MTKVHPRQNYTKQRGDKNTHQKRKTSYYLQHVESIFKGELPLQLQQKPAVAEEEVMGVDALQVLVEHGVVHLQQLRQVAELGHHGRAVGGEVAAQAVHEATEADVGLGLVLLDHQQRGGQVAHALHNVKDAHMWTGLSPGMQVNARHINATRGTSFTQHLA